MTRRETPWKLDRAYDPDQRAAALRRRFSSYLDGNAKGSRAKPQRAVFVLLLVAVAFAAIISMLI